MSVYRNILTWLEAELFEGNIKLGQELPNDRKLAGIIKASNSSTREALRQLETMGILRLYEGKRKTIIAKVVSEPFSAADPALRLHMASSRHPWRDLVQTRIMMESWAVARASSHHPAMGELDSLLESMQQEGLMPQDFHRLEVSFHIALTKLAGNQLVTGLMTALRESMYEYLLTIMGRVPLWSSTSTRLRAEHQAIVAALRAGDNALAQTLVVTTIENQYAEAGIDLDEATEVANMMPGAAPAMAPVEVESDDLVPEQWEDAVSPSVIEALENIGMPHGSGGGSRQHDFAYRRPLDFSELSQQPVDDEVDFARTRHEAPREDEPSEVEDRSTQSYNALPSVTAPASPVEESSTGESGWVKSSSYPANTDSAETIDSRRRRGKVSAPIHATVIKPIHREPLAGHGGDTGGEENPAPSRRSSDAGVAGRTRADSVTPDGGTAGESRQGERHRVGSERSERPRRAEIRRRVQLKVTELADSASPRKPFEEKNGSVISSSSSKPLVDDARDDKAQGQHTAVGASAGKDFSDWKSKHVDPTRFIAFESTQEEEGSKAFAEQERWARISALTNPSEPVLDPTEVLEEPEAVEEFSVPVRERSVKNPSRASSERKQNFISKWLGFGQVPQKKHGRSGKAIEAEKLAEANELEIPEGYEIASDELPEPEFIDETPQPEPLSKRIRKYSSGGGAELGNDRAEPGQTAEEANEKKDSSPGTSSSSEKSEPAKKTDENASSPGNEKKDSRQEKKLTKKASAQQSGKQGSAAQKSASSSNAESSPLSKKSKKKKKRK